MKECELKAKNTGGGAKKETANREDDQFYSV